jgi:hypothetical protein
MFMVTYLADCALEILILYTLFVWVRRVPGDGLMHADPDALRPWWRNNVIGRGDWLVGVPLLPCVVMTSSMFWTCGFPTASSVGMWLAGALSVVVNVLIVLLCGFYRPVAIGLFTIAAMADPICQSTAGPIDWGHIASLVFLWLAIALWMRVLQSIRRRYPGLVREQARSVDA